MTYHLITFDHISPSIALYRYEITQGVQYMELVVEQLSKKRAFTVTSFDLNKSDIKCTILG